MIRALLLSAVRAAELTGERNASPRLTAGLLLRELGAEGARRHAEEALELLRQAEAEALGLPTLRLVK